MTTDSSVTMRLDFVAPSGSATLEENSPCARATLVVDGTPGPTLASDLGGIVMQMLGVRESTNASGQAAITSSQPSQLP